MNLIDLLFLLVGLINFLPIVGILSGDRLEQLYEIPVDENNLLILLRHRALLFGIVGGLILYAVFDDSLRVVASIVGLVSMLGFIAIARQVGHHNERLRRVVFADIVGSILLVLATVLHFIL